MARFRLVVAYDGTEFHGWQSQPGLRTVQGVLERTLAEVLQVEAVKLTAAGRTDAGVHARGQVVSFAAETRLPARALAPSLNRRLPSDVVVREATEAPADFDARHSAVARRYVYRLLEADDLLLARIAWHPPRPLDPESLARATRPLEGTHDFSAFRASGGTPTRPECRMDRVAWRRWEGGLELDLVADHFLYHMVRGIVGTALAMAERPDPGAAMAEVLASRDRARTGVTAPARGLCLEQVFYDGERNR